MQLKYQYGKIALRLGKLKNFNSASKWCIQKVGLMYKRQDTKLNYDDDIFQHFKNNGFHVVQHKATGEINRIKVRQKNHIDFVEPFLLKGKVVFRRVRRENNIGQAINGKGTVVQPERQNQVKPKFKRSLVLDHGGNLVRNGG